MTPKYINYDVIILSFELLMRVKPVMTSAIKLQSQIQFLQQKNSKWPLIYMGCDWNLEIQYIKFENFLNFIDMIFPSDTNLTCYNKF